MELGIYTVVQYEVSDTENRQLGPVFPCGTNGDMQSDSDERIRRNK